MTAWIGSLVKRARGVGSARLLAAILVSATLNAGTIAYLATSYPVVRLRPVCTDWSGLWFFGPGATVDGEMAAPFLSAYHDAISGLDHHVRGKRVYIMLTDWWDTDEIRNRSMKATYNLLEARTGIDRADLWHQRRGVPEFDEVQSQDWPPCSGMKKLAIEGGEWANSGPTELKPERATGRIVPLPHLTDPLLFEPMQPRDDAGADHGNGADDRTGPPK